jgi:hypothetical protein
VEEMTFNQHLLSQSPLVVGWVAWLVILNLGAVVFVWNRVEARWVLAAMIVNMPFMNMLFYYFGYTRILGLSHIIFWTPVLVYLWRRRKDIQIKTPFGIYIRVLFISNFISLVIDYSDTIRYLLGDRHPL